MQMIHSNELNDLSQSVNPEMTILVNSSAKLKILSIMKMISLKVPAMEITLIKAPTWEMMKEKSRVPITR